MGRGKPHMNNKAAKYIRNVTETLYENSKPEERKTSLKNFRKVFKREWTKNADFREFLKSNTLANGLTS